MPEAAFVLRGPSGAVICIERVPDRERLIPGLVLGAKTDRGRVRTLGELSVHFAGTVTVAFSGGLRFKLTSRKTRRPFPESNVTAGGREG